jgi:predicted secreted hydrolase
MLYLLRGADGRVDQRSGTLVSRAARARTLAPDEWSVRATATWKSPASGATYPNRWRVDIPDEKLHLEIEPEMPDQENLSALPGRLCYWEGAVVVRATTREGRGRPPSVGRGYVELTGYGAGGRPRL